MKIVKKTLINFKYICKEFHFGFRINKSVYKIFRSLSSYTENKYRFSYCNRMAHSLTYNHIPQSVLNFKNLDE